MAYKHYKKHPCNMSSSSIKEYTNKLNEKHDLIPLIHETFDRINRLSGIIKAHPHTKISKNNFYMIKSMFTYFMYTLCTPNDEKYDVDFQVKPINKIYKPYITYNLEFIIGGVSKYISAQYNSNLISCSEYLEEFFQDFNNPEIINEYHKNDYTGLTENDVYKEYVEFIEWCTENNWYFTFLYDECFVFDKLKKIFKDSKYAIHYQQKYSSISKMFRILKFYIYIMDENGNLTCGEDYVRFIRYTFDDIKDVAKQLTIETVIQKSNIEGNRKYSVYVNDKEVYHDIEVDVAKAISEKYEFYNKLNNTNNKVKVCLSKNQ